MNDTKFPSGLSDELSNKTFDEVFVQNPKLVEFADSLWVEAKTTGIFLDFYKYVKCMLSNPIVSAEHNDRCIQFVKNLGGEHIPTYLVKFKNKNTEHVS